MRLLFQISHPLLSSVLLPPFHRQHIPMKLLLRFSLSLAAACCFSEWQQIAFFMQAWAFSCWINLKFVTSCDKHKSMSQQFTARPARLWHYCTKHQVRMWVHKTRWDPNTQKQGFSGCLNSRKAVQLASGICASRLEGRKRDQIR